MAQVNGKTDTSVDGCTIGAALERLGFDRARVACELNGEIVPRAEYDERALDEHDALEVVRCVGGG